MGARNGLERPQEKAGEYALSVSTAEYQIRDGTQLIAYVNTIFRSIDARLWLLFAIAAALIWLPVFIRKRRAYTMRGVITYAILILMVTLFSREGTHQRPPELLPFWSWVEVFRHRNWELLYQIFLNVLLFLPLGVLLYCCTRIRKNRHPLLTIWLIGLGLSACIEMSQLHFQLGLFEWDDILHNSIGTLLGSLVVHRIRENIR